MVTTTDLAGYVSYAFILIGLWGIGRKQRWGWVSKAIGDAGWVGVGWHIGLSSIWLPELVFFSMDLWYFVAWGGYLEASKPKSERPPVTATRGTPSSRNVP